MIVIIEEHVCYTYVQIMHYHMVISVHCIFIICSIHSHSIFVIMWKYMNFIVIYFIVFFLFLRLYGKNCIIISVSQSAHHKWTCWPNSKLVLDHFWLFNNDLVELDLLYVKRHYVHMFQSWSNKEDYWIEFWVTNLLFFMGACVVWYKY